MRISKNPIIIEESIIKAARDLGICVHYDDGSGKWYFIIVTERYIFIPNDLHESNVKIDQKVELRMLFTFFDEYYEVYSLLSNDPEKKTFKANFVCRKDIKAILKSKLPFIITDTFGKSPRITRFPNDFRDNYYSYKGKIIGDYESTLIIKLYAKWHIEIDNIADFLDQDGIDFSVEVEDYGIVLYCEALTNSNYAIIYLSTESRVVKIDKSTFNSFLPKVGQIYKVIKEVNYCIGKSSVAKKTSSVMFLVKMLNECKNLRLLFDKYDECFNYAAKGINKINLNSIENEGYFLISYTGTDVKLKANKVTKHLIYDFILDYDSNYKNVGKKYVGKSLVCIKRKKQNLEYYELNAFGRIIDKENYDKKANKKLVNNEKGYSLNDAKKEEAYWNDYYNDLINDEVAELANTQNDDEVYMAELYDDSDAVFDLETKTDFLSEMDDYYYDELDNLDELEKIYYNGSDIDDGLDLRDIYNARNLELELRLSESSYYDDYDPYEEYELAFEKWVNEKYGDSIYDGFDITDERFYLSITKKKYNFKTIDSKDKMFLRVLYDEYLLKEANERMLERSFNEMVINVKKHPLSNFFVDELELFKESRLVAIVGFNNNTFKNLNLKDLLNRNAYSDFEIKGLIITYSAIHPDFYKVLNDQIDLLPENVSCIVYGGVELTSKENKVEIFVIQ